jgi:riboflavin kinase/FMN adenylyltransferase
MIRINDDSPLPRSLGRPVATVGVFDGVHKGHQRVLGALGRWGRRLGAKTLVVTFDRSPRTITRGEHVPCITSLEHKLVLFERLGIDAAAVLHFNDRLREMPAREFAKRTLCGRLRSSGILLGFDHRFGRGGEGDFELLKELERDGVCLAKCAGRPATVDGRPVSSSAIRAAIESGELALARRMLGRPVSLLGTVVRGRGVGRRLGFPTANLDLHHEVRPPAGVYLCTARLGRTWRRALTSIGRQQTFGEDAEEVVEVYVHRCRKDLYGRDLEVRFARVLRPQITFARAEELVERMRQDVQALERARLPDALTAS